MNRVEEGFVEDWLDDIVGRREEMKVLMGFVNVCEDDLVDVKGVIEDGDMLWGVLVIILVKMLE